MLCGSPFLLINLMDEMLHRGFAVFVRNVLNCTHNNFL